MFTFHYVSILICQCSERIIRKKDVYIPLCLYFNICFAVSGNPFDWNVSLYAVIAYELQRIIFSFQIPIIIYIKTLLHSVTSGSLCLTRVKADIRNPLRCLLDPVK